MRVDGVGQVELAVELAAAGAARRRLLVPRRHHQLAVDRLHRQVARLKLGPDLHRDAKHLYTQRRGVVVSGVRRTNEVNARRARLVPGWVTVLGRVYHLGM